MADSKSTGVPAFLLSKPVPAVRHGDLVHVVGPVAFTDLKHAVCASGAVEAEFDAERAESLPLERKLRAKHKAQDTLHEGRAHRPYAVSRATAKRPAKAEQRAIGEHIEQQRRRLLGADAVIICVQRAIDSRQAPPDEIRVGDALQVASDIINDAVEALERMTP